MQNDRKKFGTSRITKIEESEGLIFPEQKSKDV